MLVPWTRKAWATKAIRKKQNSTATERSCRNSQTARRNAAGAARRCRAGRRLGAGSASSPRLASSLAAELAGLEGHRLAPFTTRVAGDAVVQPAAAEGHHQEADAEARGGRAGSRSARSAAQPSGIGERPSSVSTRRSSSSLPGVAPFTLQK